MMFKAFRSVPANTSEYDPTWEKLDVAQGTLVGWVIFSDPEAANLLHFRIEYHKLQLMPFTGDSWIEGFLEPITIEESIRIDEVPYVFDIYAYNEDDSHPHEYYIHPIIIPDKALELGPPISQRIIEAFKGMFGGA